MWDNNFLLVFFLLLAVIGTSVIILLLQNHRATWQKKFLQVKSVKRKRSSVLFNSIHVEKECYSKPENIYKTLNDANIKLNFLKETEK